MVGLPVSGAARLDAVFSCYDYCIQNRPRRANLDLTGRQGSAENVVETWGTIVNDSEKRLLTVAEAAKLLGLSKTRTYSLVMSGELESLKLGKARRIPVIAIDEFVETKRREQGY